MFIPWSIIPCSSSIDSARRMKQPDRLKSVAKLISMEWGGKSCSQTTPKIEIFIPWSIVTCSSSINLARWMKQHVSNNASKLIQGSKEGNPSQSIPKPKCSLLWSTSLCTGSIKSAWWSKDFYNFKNFLLSISRQQWWRKTHLDRPPRKHWACLRNECVLQEVSERRNIINFEFKLQQTAR